MKKTSNKIKKVEKKLSKAVKAEARSVKFHVKKLSNQVQENAGRVAGQVAEKVEQVSEKVKKHPNFGKLLVGAAVAGITLIASLGAYSIYLVRNKGRKIDFNKMKIDVLREVRMASQKAQEAGKMKVEKLSQEARKFAKKI